MALRCSRVCTVFDYTYLATFHHWWFLKSLFQLSYEYSVSDIWPLVHADGSSEGIPLGNQSGFRWGFRTGVWVSAVIIAHGLDVAAAPHASTRNLPSAVTCAATAVPTSPVFGWDLRHSHICTIVHSHISIKKELRVIHNLQLQHCELKSTTMSKAWSNLVLVWFFINGLNS